MGDLGGFWPEHQPAIAFLSCLGIARIGSGCTLRAGSRLYCPLHHRWLPRKFIFKGQITPSDGRLAQTGAPPHHTFWAYDGVDLISRFTLHVLDVG